MSPEKYHYYRLDEGRRLHDAVEFSADDDDRALKQISRLHPTSRCELWLASRIVGTTRAEQRDEDGSARRSTP